MKTVELQARLGTLFNAWTGPPRAYIEIETGDNGSGPLIRIQYRVYALAMEVAADDTRDCEALLCDELFKRFTANLSDHDKEDQRRTLIWRRDAYYNVDPVLAWNKDHDMYDIPTGRVRHLVSLRCHCPCVDSQFVTPEGGEIELLLGTAP